MDAMDLPMDGEIENRKSKETQLGTHGSTSEGIRNRRRTSADSERNLLEDLTDARRTISVDNGGCQFQIVEHDGVMRVSHVCSGKSSDQIDLIGDSSNVPWDFLLIRKMRKHHVRMKFYKSDDVLGTGSFLSSNVSKSVGPVLDGQFADAVEEFQPTKPQLIDQVSIPINYDDAQAKQVERHSNDEAMDADTSGSGVGRFGLMKKLKQDESG